MSKGKEEPKPKAPEPKRELQIGRAVRITVFLGILAFCGWMIIGILAVR